ncbi:hypothetical protein [Ralstonia wenshanensis]|uniref:hypothetical protein n=1 Tax=Ralstonia wenshanensis TaxID=2842456 RepID=UPI0029308F80|nr:hypothetical protein [Ralstonia wenshanensis]
MALLSMVVGLISFGMASPVLAQSAATNAVEAFKADLNARDALGLPRAGGKDGEPLTHEMLDRRQAAIQQVRAAPGKYTPRTLLALSDRLTDERERAFWELAAIVRATVDLPSCGFQPSQVGVAEWLGLSEVRNPSSPESVWRALMPSVVDWDRKTPREYDPYWRYFSIDDLDRGKPLPMSTFEYRSTKNWTAAAECLRKTLLEYAATGAWPKWQRVTTIAYNWDPSFTSVNISLVEEHNNNEKGVIAAILGKREVMGRDFFMPPYWKPDEGLMLDWAGFRDKKLIIGQVRPVPIASDANSDLKPKDRPFPLMLHFCPGGGIKATVAHTPEAEIVSPCDS